MQFDPNVQHRQLVNTPQVVTDSWKELWKALAHRKDGSLRPVPQSAEDMIMRLKRAEQREPHGDLADVLRFTLRQYCRDLPAIEKIDDNRLMSSQQQREVMEDWFSYRASAHSWQDLSEAVSGNSAARILATVVAQDLAENWEQFLPAISVDSDPYERGAARRVLRFLGESFSLFNKTQAGVLAELAHDLYRSRSISECEYAQKLLCFVKSPGASFSECVNHLARAHRAFPHKISAETEAELVQVGQIIGHVVADASREDILRLLDAPVPVVVGVAPHFIRKQVAELPSEHAVTAIERICCQLGYAATAMNSDVLGRASGPISEVIFQALTKLPTTEALLILEISGPLLARTRWFSREAEGMWELLSKPGDGDRHQLQLAVLRQALTSPLRMSELCDWIAIQVNFPFFRTRLEELSNLLQGVLRARYELGEKGVSANETIAALRLISELGELAMDAISDVAALVGVPVATLWVIGPVCMPYMLPVDRDAEVVEAARYTLHTLAHHCRPGFEQKLSARGV